MVIVSVSVVWNKADMADERNSGNVDLSKLSSHELTRMLRELRAKIVAIQAESERREHLPPQKP